MAERTNSIVSEMISRWESRTGHQAVNARQADQSDLTAVIEAFKADRKWLDQHWQEADRMCGVAIQTLEFIRENKKAEHDGREND